MRREILEASGLHKLEASGLRADSSFPTYGGIMKRRTTHTGDLEHYQSSP